MFVATKSEIRRKISQRFKRNQINTNNLLLITKKSSSKEENPLNKRIWFDNQKKIAEEIGIHEQTLSKILNGRQGTQKKILV